jgi:apolipoprotein N-acyltransferase
MRRIAEGILGVLATGVMLHFALPPLGWWPLGWIAFVPLFLAVRETRFLIGFLGGLVSIGITAWLGIQGFGYRYTSDEGSPSWVMVGCALFGFALAIVAGLSAETKLERPWRLAAIAVLLEACLLIYLPASVALTQSRVPAMMLVASLGGVWAIAYLVWFTNLTIAQQLARGQRVRRVRVAIALAIMASCLVTFNGTLRKVWLQSENRSVLLVQTAATDLKELHQLNGSVPDALAIWPEFAGMEASPGGDTEELRAYSQNATPFVTSYQSGHRPLPFNVAALFAGGTESVPYRKRKLFGGEVSMHQAGLQPAVAPWRGMTVGLNICFDSCYPAVMRETADLSPSLIALPTIDPPSPHHWIAAMHAEYTPIRSAELGIPIARADGHAYSMLTDAHGNVMLELPPGEASALAPLFPARPSTLYRRFGDWVLYACGLALLAPAFVGLFRKRKERTAEATGLDS